MMRIDFKAMRFPTQSSPAPLADLADTRPVCFSDDKEFFLPKKGPDGKPLMRTVKKGPNKGRQKPVLQKVTLLIRGCEIRDVIYRATSRSSSITAGRAGREWKLTVQDFLRTAMRTCGPEEGIRAARHLCISDRLLASYQAHHIRTNGARF